MPVRTRSHERMLDRIYFLVKFMRYHDGTGGRPSRSVIEIAIQMYWCIVGDVNDIYLQATTREVYSPLSIMYTQFSVYLIHAYPHLDLEDSIQEVMRDCERRFVQVPPVVRYSPACFNEDAQE